MKFYHTLYWSETLTPRKEVILEHLRQGKWQMNKYLIVLAKDGCNHLEFYSTVMLLQQVFSSEDIFVVGIADGYDGALELIERITREVYDETQSTDIRGYLLSKQREYETGNV